MSDNSPTSTSTLIERLNGSSDAVVAIDGNFNISYFNREAEKVFGYSQKELLGKPLVLLLPKYSRRNHNQNIKQFENSGDNDREIEDRIAVSGLAKDGEILILDVSIHKHKNEEVHKYSAICRKLS